MTAAYGVGVLIIATIFAMLDRQILVLLAQPIGDSLHVSDGQIGLLLGTGLTLFVGIGATPVGWLADRWGRQNTLCVCILIWSIGTAACGFASSFLLLFVSAATVGIGESSLSPIAFGLIPDIVPERRRVLANSVYQLAVYMGSGLGLLLGGALVQHVDGLRPALPPILRNLPAWRLAFFAVAFPAPIVALMVLIIRARAAPLASLVVPARPKVRMLPFLAEHWATLALIFGAMSFGLFGVYAVVNWIPTVAVRVFHVGVADAGKSVGTTYLVATLAGAILAIAGGSPLRSRFGVGGPVIAFSLAMLVAGIACISELFARTPLQVYTLFGFQAAAIVAGGTLTPTLLQDMTPPALRSRITGIAVSVGLATSSLSPVAVGFVSETMPGSPRGLLTSVVIVGTLGFVCSAVMFYLARPFFVRTVTAVNADLSEARG